MMRAFSLIELMVVIAIVALLSSVAVPAYKNYVITSRIHSYIPVLSDIANRAIIYADKNGGFPDARDLGYPEDPAFSGDTTYGLPSTIGSNVTEFGVLYSGACREDVEVYIYIDTNSLGFGSDVDTFYMDLLVKHKDGTMLKSEWTYGYGLGAVSYTDEFISNMVNANEGSGWDYSDPAYNNFLDDATCM